MKNKIFVTALVLCASFSSAHAQLKFLKKNPLIATAGAIGIVGTSVYRDTILAKARDLSFNLNKVVPYFEAKPDDFNPVADYVLNALATTQKRSDYDRYAKLAEVMGIGQLIPPFSPIANTKPLAHVNPIVESLPQNPGYSPVALPNIADNIIFTPQGQKLDTSTFFPIERPKNWTEYLSLKQHSTELAENMNNAGMGKKPVGYAAHHIVPATAAGAQAAREILNKYGIHFNSELNGVYLPTPKDKVATQGVEHNGRHPKLYVDKVTQLIQIADLGGKAEVLNTLAKIKYQLSTAPKNSDWGQIL